MNHFLVFAMFLLASFSAFGAGIEAGEKNREAARGPAMIWSYLALAILILLALGA